MGIAVDTSGSVYLADRGNNAVRKITPDGAVTTVGGVAGKVGIGLGALPSSLSHPTAVTVTAKGLIVSSENALLLVPE
ncbi:hypothetical protein [Undibacterium terreum]|uniref:NHL repeat-containing protein n=1 Tax=Undibacterium terreum TaxID=1224302 RepID=A0A916UTH0_9BURK|nr:hypothetical protein GCM10011396_37920 [Undibacterium terreum]